MINVVIVPGRVAVGEDETKAGPNGSNELEAETDRGSIDIGRAHTTVPRITEGGGGGSSFAGISITRKGPPRGADNRLARHLSGELRRDLYGKHARTPFRRSGSDDTDRIFRGYGYWPIDAIKDMGDKGHGRKGA